MSQATLAEKISTSQSAIARIEGGEENVTEITLERIITALHGRFRVSITPAEFALPAQRNWWETVDAVKVSLKGIEYRLTDQEHEIRVTLGMPIRRANTLPPANSFIDAKAS
jgi:transcriptional regulator with XRE-family HTH domain